MFNGAKVLHFFLNYQNFLPLKFIFTNNLEFTCVCQKKLYFIVYMTSEAQNKNPRTTKDARVHSVLTQNKSSVCP